MNQNRTNEQKRRRLRLVQMILFLTGVAFVVVAAVLFALGSGDSNPTLMIMAAVLLLAGISDLVFSWFFFSRLSERPPARPEDYGQGQGDLRR